MHDKIISHIKICVYYITIIIIKDLYRYDNIAYRYTISIACSVVFNSLVKYFIIIP